MGPLRGFDLWNPPVTRKGGPLMFPFPLQFFWEKLLGPRYWGTLLRAFLASFLALSSDCLFHQLWRKLLGIGQATMALTGGSHECPTIPSKAENEASDCVTFGRTCAQQCHNAPSALNRIIGQERSHRNGTT